MEKEFKEIISILKEAKRLKYIGGVKRDRLLLNTNAMDIKAACPLLLFPPLRFPNYVLNFSHDYY